MALLLLSLHRLDILPHPPGPPLRVLPRLLSLPDTINLLFEIAWCLEVPITILYWGVLFDYSGSYEAGGIVKDVGVHGFPFFCLLVDFIFNSYQFPWRHLPVVLALGLFYLVVNLGLNFQT